MTSGRPSPLKHVSLTRPASTCLTPTIAAMCLNDFSWRTLALRPIVAPISDADRVAIFAANDWRRRAAGT